jgi:hypothetical protein
MVTVKEFPKPGDIALPDRKHQVFVGFSHSVGKN